MLKRSELSKMRFHDPRHTAATLILNNNMPAIVVSKRFGHAMTSITLDDTYGHMIQTMEDEAAKVMDDLVTPIEFNPREMDAQEVETGNINAQKPR